MHRISLDLAIKLGSRWHAGTGEGSQTVNRIIRRDSANLQYIPGSTLKGIVRESCERLCRTFGFPEPHDPHAKNIRDKGVFGPIEQVSSPADALFGNKFESGEIFFRDVRLDQNAVPEKCCEITRTSMYRGLRTVRKGHLFTSEYAGEECFRTTIDGFHRQLLAFESNDIPLAYCLLIAGILNIDRIGAEKSTGCGVVDISITKAEYNGRVIKAEEIFEYLDKGLYDFSKNAAKEAV